MADSGTPDQKGKSRLTSAILMAWLIAGTMDILAAIVPYTIRTGNSPIKIFEYIASALFGQEMAFSGNSLMAFSGFVFHYIIAFIWTCLFFLAYPKVPLLRRNRFIVGIGYGAFVWTIMNLVVLPLSRIPPIPFDPGRAIIACLILMACIGTPISMVANRHYSSQGK